MCCLLTIVFFTDSAQQASGRELSNRLVDVAAEVFDTNCESCDGAFSHPCRRFSAYRVDCVLSERASCSSVLALHTKRRTPYLYYAEYTCRSDEVSLSQITQRPGKDRVFPDSNARGLVFDPVTDIILHEGDDALSAITDAGVPEYPYWYYEGRCQPKTGRACTVSIALTSDYRRALRGSYIFLSCLVGPRNRASVPVSVANTHLRRGAPFSKTIRDGGRGRNLVTGSLDRRGDVLRGTVQRTAPQDLCPDFGPLRWTAR